MDIIDGIQITPRYAEFSMTWQWVITRNDGDTFAIAPNYHSVTHWEYDAAKAFREREIRAHETYGMLAK